MIESIGDGGIAHYAYNLINKLAEKGLDVTLLTGKRYELSEMPRRFKLCNRMFRIAAYVLKRWPVLDQESGAPAVLRRAIKVMEYPLNTLEAVFHVLSENVRIVHLQSVNLIELMMVIAFRIAGRKVVYTIHNVMPRHQKLRFYHRVLYRALYSLCHELIINSAKGREEVVELFRVSRRKNRVMPHRDYKCLVPAEPIPKEKAKEALGLEKNCRTILFFGAIRESKGLDSILRALPAIKSRVGGVKLLIVGEPWENYEKYKKLIRENKLEEQVLERLDYVPNQEVPLYFFATDLVVLPYREITQSGILQMAYAFAKPVVATDLGGFREAIEEGKNGCLVPVGDIQALAEKCSLVLADEESIQRMGEHSRRLADERFSWDLIAERTIREVYGAC